MLINFKHLSQVEETYIEHFKFAVWAGCLFLVLGIVSLIHAIFPFILARTPDQIYSYFQRASSQRQRRVEKVLKEKRLE